MNIHVREGRKGDIPAILELIHQLAVYEKAPDEVEVTEESMLKDAFGENAVYGFYVATVENEIVGTAIYYYRYSTWKGKRLYLEDFVVKETFRNKGVGKSLFDQMLIHAQTNECRGMSWQVLEWNEDAIRFYNRYPTEFDGEWLNGSISEQEIRNWKK